MAGPGGWTPHQPGRWATCPAIPPSAAPARATWSGRPGAGIQSSTGFSTGKGPRGVVPPGPGGPAALPGIHEARPGAAGTPVRPPGRGGGGAHGKRRGVRRGPLHRGGVLREGGDPGHGHISLRPDHRGRMRGGFRARRHARRRPADRLPEALGLPLRRFKTGTPPRVNARSVDFDEMELQPGDALPVPFSYGTQSPPENRAVCWLTWTTEETLRIVLENLDRAPMYSGVIEGVGPRYCPSFETKMVRFPDKERHQLFVEPMGLTRRNCISRASPPPCPRTCRFGCSTPCPDWDRRR